MASRRARSLARPRTQRCASSAVGATRSKFLRRPLKAMVRQRAGSKAPPKCRRPSDWWPSRMASMCWTKTIERNGPSVAGSGRRGQAATVPSPPMPSPVPLTDVLRRRTRDAPLEPHAHAVLLQPVQPLLLPGPRADLAETGAPQHGPHVLILRQACGDGRPWAPWPPVPPSRSSSTHSPAGRSILQQSLGGLSQEAPPLQVTELALALGFLAPRPMFDVSPWNGCQ